MNFEDLTALSRVEPSLITASIAMSALSPAATRVNARYREYFALPAGKEHYSLLSYLSLKQSNSLFIDIGSLLGLSAAALSYNRSNDVVSIDVAQTLEVDEDALPNVNFMRFNALAGGAGRKLFLTLCRRSSLILLDVDPHDGEKEREFMALIRASGFRGVVLLDDIHLNAPMEAFWRGIPEPKVDLTAIGHHSGTGAVVI